MDTLLLTLSDHGQTDSGTKGGLAARKPTLLFRFSGVLLLRMEERRLSAWLFQEPPRITRDTYCPFPV